MKRKKWKRGEEEKGWKEFRQKKQKKKRRMRRGKKDEKEGEGERRKEKRRGRKEKRRKKKNKNRESSARDALLSPDAFLSRNLGNNMTPIEGRLGKNTTPTCRRTAALTPNLQKDPQQRRPDFDDSSYPDFGYASEKKKYTNHKPHSNEAAIYKKIKALGKLARTFQILHQSALNTFAPF